MADTRENIVNVAGTNNFFNRFTIVADGKEKLKFKPVKVNEQRKSYKPTNEKNDISTENAKQEIIKVENLSESLKKHIKFFTETPELNEQVKTVFANLSRKAMDSITIVGEAGCGKTTIVEYLTECINSSKCPDSFKNTTVIKIESTTFPYQATEEEMVGYLYLVLEYLKKNNEKIIIYFENSEWLPDSFKIGFFKIMRYLKEQFNFKLFNVIMELRSEYVETTQELFALSFLKDSVYYRLDISYDVEKVSNFLQPRIRELTEYHNVEISKKYIDYIFYMYWSKAFDVKVKNLKTCLHYIDIAMAKCKMDNRSKIKFKDIQSVFYKDFKCSRQLTKKEKLKVAYHEAGHTLVILLYPDIMELELVKCIFDIEFLFRGSTTVKFDYIRRSKNKDDLINILSFYLAGREAEKIIDKKEDLGAAGDLEVATDTAKDFVCQSGIFKSIGINCYYDWEEGNISAEAIRGIELETEKLISKATQKTKKILKKHKKFLDILANKMVKKGILTKKDVYKLWNKYVKDNMK